MPNTLELIPGANHTVTQDSTTKLISRAPDYQATFAGTSGGDGVVTGIVREPFVVEYEVTSAGGAAQTLTLQSFPFKTIVLDFAVIYDEDPADDKDIELTQNDGTVIATCTSGLAAVLYQSIDTTVNRASKIQNGVASANRKIAANSAPKVVFETNAYDCVLRVTLARTL